MVYMNLNWKRFHAIQIKDWHVYVKMISLYLIMYAKLVLVGDGVENVKSNRIMIKFMK
jgi:hypothetical protein